MNIFNLQKIRKQIGPTVSRPRLAALVLGLIALLGLTWLGITSQTVVVGQRVRALEGKLDRVNHENAQLEYEIAVLTQPKRIADRATLLGLRPATSGQTTYTSLNYTPRLTASQEQSTMTTGHSSTWVAWWNNLVNWLGLGADTRTAEASH